MITKVCQFQANPGERLVEVFTPGEMEKAASFFNMGKTAAPLLAPVQQYLEKLQADPNKIYVLVNALGAGEYWGCFPAGAPVQTKRGWVPIEQVRVGEEVLTHQNRWRPVTATQVRDHEGELWDLEIAGLPRHQPYISATPNHEMYVVLRDELVRARRKHLYTRNKNTTRSAGREKFLRAVEFDWAAISDLRRGDYVAQPFPTDEDSPLQMLADGQWSHAGIAALAGIYAAEGCVANRYDDDMLPDTDPCYKIIYTLGPEEDGVAEKIDEVANLHGYHPTIRKHDNHIRVELCWSELARLFRDHIGHHATEKFLSPDLLTMPRGWQREFFAWYAKGDGCVRSPGKGEDTVRCVSASLQLLYDVRLMMARLGKLGQITGRHNEASSFYNGNPIFEMAISGSQERGDAANVEGYIHPEGYILSPIRKVSCRPFMGVVHNIEVDEDESYTVGGLAVHNSNINGDYFPEGSLVHKGMDWGYETFYNAYPYKHHVNKDPSRSFGKVELAVWHDGMKRVELVIAIDRARAKMFGAEDICDKLDQGMFPDVSMGCFTGDTPVTMADGTRLPISAIKVGDLVLTHEGRARKVKQVHRRMYRGDLYTIKAEAHRAVRCTHQHPWYVVPEDQVKYKDSHANMRWREDVALTPIWQPAETLGDQYLLEPVRNLDEAVPAPSRAGARLLGYYLAEGHLLRDKRGRISGIELTTNKHDYVHEEIEQLCAEFGTKNSPCTRPRENSKDALKISIHDRRLAEMCLRQAGVYSREKRLDENTMRWPVESLAEMLGAYANGDGCAYEGTLKFSTASEDLAWQISATLSRLSMMSSVSCIRHKAGSGYSREDTFEWVVHVGKQWAPILAPYCQKLVPVEVFKTKNSRMRYGRHVVTPIKEIETMYVETEVFNLEVEEDESYLVEGLAVHNCKVPYDLCSKCLDWEKYRRAQSTYDPLIHRTVGQAVLAYHRRDPIRGLSVTRNDYCEHLKTMLNKILPDGTKIYAINDYPRFFDISFVFIGADKTAKVMAKLAEAHSCFNGTCVPSWMIAEQQYGAATDSGFEKTASFSPAGHGLSSLESILSDIGVERSAASDIGRTLSSPIESIRSKLREKKASHDKWAEIIKNVAPSQFGNKAIRLDRQGSDLPNNVLDSLGEHGDLSQALSTPTSMGIVLRPREFQRITLISIGRKPMADSMDSEGSVFRPCDEEDSSVPMGPGHFSSILKRILLPLMEDRSFLEPVARRRVVRISIHPAPHHGMGMARMTHFAEPNPLLTKISAAYNSYLDRIGNCMGHAEEIVNEHPDVWEAAFRSGVEEGFLKEASGMKPGSLPIVLGSIAGAALLSNYADYQRQRAMQGDREPVSALTALAADNPRTMMLLAGMGAMHLRGSNIPRRIVGTAAGALKGFLGAKPR